ncbi:NB-ARC domain-containing protein [Streptomyces pathocidini]|uniref:NB-ARC domain-containing protein n=1 Tax=Streptomyces pathocidini TaxID=1650571 RepID=UPI0033D2BC9D
MTAVGPPGGYGGARPPSVANHLSGHAGGPVVQAGRIHGGIAYNYHLPPPAPDDVPDQVPAVRRFTNRTKDLSALDSWLARYAADAPGIGVLSGLPGVGKTAMACRWAGLARERFPDGQIYVDFASLRDRAGGDVSEAVGMCLRALGVSDQYLPGSLAERVGWYRTRSAGRRMLLVLDDVTEPAQVTALVPKGRGSAVLVTSHRDLSELALDQAEFLRLEPLDRDGGIHLLAELCGADAIAADRPAAERLVELCGGLPVALHLVAARLRTCRRLTLTGLAGELADATRRLGRMSVGRERSMSAVLGLAYHDLPEEAARLYRLLGWVPGRTFDAGTAAAAAGTDSDAAQDLLDTLEAASLLDATEDGRYRFHDLVRLHARETAAETGPGGEADPGREGRAVIARVTTHYLALTAFADRAVREDRLRIADLSELLRQGANPFAEAGRASALAWTAAERPNIMATLRAAAEQGADGEVWPLAEAFTVLFLHHRHLGDWKESLELGAAAAARAGEPAAEARLRSLLSRPLLDLGEDDRAHEELQTAVARADASGHPVLRASVREFLGRYWDRADPARAIAVHREALDLNTAAGERRGAAIAAYFLGAAQDAAGDHTTALATLRGARGELLELGDARMAARAAAAIGLAHGHLDEPSAARDELREAVQVLREQDAHHYEAQALVALADLVPRTGEGPATVREYLARAVEIHEEGGSPAAEALRERLNRLEKTPG